MSQWLIDHDLPYRDSQEKAYSTDANIWGATHEAKTLEHLDVSLETVEPIMGVKFWDPAVAIETEDVTVRFEAGPPGRDQRHAGTTTRWRWSTRPTSIGGRHGLGMSDQIENRIIEAKSRGIYEAPGDGAAVDRRTSGCSTRSTTRTPSPTTTPRAAGSAGCSTRAAGSTRRR